MEEVAARTGTPWPLKPAIPDRPTVKKVPVPELPTPHEYYQLERRLAEEIKQLRFSIPLGGGKKTKRRRARMEQELEVKKQKARSALIRFQLSCLTADDRAAYDSAIAHNASVDSTIQAWENQVSAASASYAAKVDHWRRDRRNGSAKIQRSIIERLKVRLDAHRRGVVEISPETKITKVSWQLLPPPPLGSTGIAKALDELQAACPHIRFDRQRLEFAYLLGPEQIFIGHGEFDGYLAFQFARTERVLLENPVHGNAAYIFRSDWKTLSRLSRSELLNFHKAQVTRVIHAGKDWRREIKSLLRL